MKAVRVVAKDTLEIQDIPTPSIGPDEVLMKVRAAGICGTDLRIYHSGGQGALPITMGHEFVGDVAQVGSQVKDLEIGQKIISVPIFTDGTCFACIHGHFHVCDVRKVHGVDVDGGMAEFVRVQRRHVFVVPDHLPYREAVAVEPVANCVHAFERSHMVAGESVAIFGDGFHGLTMLRLARLHGGQPLVFCGHHEDRFHIAKDFGADVLINTNSEDPVPRIQTMFADNGHGVDVGMDTTDSRTALREVVGSVRKCGKLLLFASPRALEAEDWQPMRMKELDVYPSHSWPEVFPEALELVASRKVDVRPMLTHFFPADQALRAFEVADKRLDNSIRVVVEF